MSTRSPPTGEGARVAKPLTRTSSPADADFDLQRLADLPGASFTSTVTNRNGENLNAKAGLDTLLNPQEIYGYGSTTRLAQLYVQQRWGRPGDGEAGPPADERRHLPVLVRVPEPDLLRRGAGLHHARADSPGPSASGRPLVDLRLSGALRFKTAVYQVNPGYLDNDEGLDLGSPSGTTGAHVVGPTDLDAASRRTAGDLPDRPVAQHGRLRGPGGPGLPLRKHASGYYLMAGAEPGRGGQTGRAA